MKNVELPQPVVSTRIPFAFLAVLLLSCLGISSLAFSEPAAVDEYRLAAGDRVKITVFGHEDLSGEFDVNPTGQISMPLIDEIPAAGQTPRGLEDAIVQALQPDYLKHPNVRVEVLSYRPVYILGEVSAPGSYPFVNGMTVVNAVAVAGGFTYRARKGRIKIVRDNSDESVEISAQLDTPLLPGDVIEVPERFF
jgi:protein involved in polysaccharide export with SLBB domain